MGLSVLSVWCVCFAALSKVSGIVGLRNLGTHMQENSQQELDNTCKNQPKIYAIWPQKGLPQSPSEPPGAPFARKLYCKALWDVIFEGFGSSLASLGAPFSMPFGL